MKKEVILSLIALVVLCIVVIAVREPHLVYFFQKGADTHATSPCNSSLWNYNAEEEQVITPCVTFTGVVQSTHAEDDGDQNIQLRPDPEYIHLINTWNIVGQWGNIALEPICENPSSKKSFRKACAGYVSSINLPHTGEHISVTGSYGADKHGWVEIHPVTKIEKIE